MTYDLADIPHSPPYHSLASYCLQLNADFALAPVASAMLLAFWGMVFIHRHI